MKYRIIILFADDTIAEIYEFDARTRKDGISKPLCDFLDMAFQEKPEGGKILIDKID